MQSALDIISRSLILHPSMLIESLQTRAWEDARYSASRENPAVKKSVLASFDATMRAIDYLNAETVDRFRDDMAAGIIALNTACKLQCLPPHIRTESAVALWG